VSNCLHRNESYVLQKAGKYLFIRKATMSFAGLLFSIHLFTDDQLKGSHKKVRCVIKTNSMHYLSSVYFVCQPLHVSDIFVADHQEVYCIYTTTGTCYAFRSKEKHNTYKLLCIYIYTGCHRRKEQNFGRVFLMLNYTEKPQNTYIQS
jgi:hypothetical protein